MVLKCITEEAHLERDAAVVHARITKRQCLPRPHERDRNRNILDRLWKFTMECWNPTPGRGPSVAEVQNFFLSNRGRRYSTYLCITLSLEGVRFDVTSGGLGGAGQGERCENQHQQNRYYCVTAHVNLFSFVDYSSSLVFLPRKIVPALSVVYQALISSAGFETYRDGFCFGEARNPSAGFHRFVPASSHACHAGVGRRSRDMLNIK